MTAAEVKHSSKKEDSRRSHSERDREKDKERHSRDRGKEREKKDRESRRSERERSVDEKYRERDGLREKHKERDRDRGRTRGRDEERDRARDKSREDREAERDREDRERQREKERERLREKERERDRAREREKREREREERERDRVREREKRRDVERDDSSGDEGVRDRERKRRRRDDDNVEKERERERERSGRSRRHKDGSEDSPKNDPEMDKKEKKTTREEDLEEEQRKLDEEMEKRRRRVQEWQDLRRKQEESERESLGQSNGDQPKSGKTWTLEGESDDEEAPVEGKFSTDMDADEDAKPSDENGDAMVVDANTGTATPALQSADAGDADGEIDPLDAFMNSLVLPEAEKLNSADVSSTTNNVKDSVSGKIDGLINGEQPKRGSSKSIGRIMQGEDSDSDYGESGDEATKEEEDDDGLLKDKKSKVEKLAVVNHAEINYPKFRKDFYIEVKEISRMTPAEVAAYRKELELKMHGKDVPKPIKSWHQTGLTSKVLDTLKRLNFEKPMPIQAQALPIIMSGRDCIGIGKTGSGKTLAFVLPMLRHIKDQPFVNAGDGPIALIMAPTRELVKQISNDIKKFAKVVGFRCAAIYGGSGVAQQISELKRGAEIVVCTPGRMIDMLSLSGGKVTNLRRVTYLVMDEADRMFDMGFEPQITHIFLNTRPDRQTVLFSATFPRQVEILARRVLTKPVEIQVGGRSVVNKDITQLIEVRPENERFLRLLELLGEWHEKGKILIFVESQDKCDSLFRDLIRQGYPCLSLHGAKDQTDRESTISDFKSNVCNLLIATSIAARGLDVKELELVVNYDVPNHYEDYVHRVGRTGRAGRKGCAVTFIPPDKEQYAPDLVKALELSEQVVPDDLKALADSFLAKVREGKEVLHSTGFGGSGYKFNEEEDEVRRAAKKAQAKEYGFEEDKSDSEDEDDGVRKTSDISQQASLAPLTNPVSVPNNGVPVPLTSVPAVASALPNAAIAAFINLQHNLAKIQADAMPEHYEAELEINDYPQNARWKVTHKETLGPISEWTGAAITTRGQYFPSGKIPGPGERKLYLFIEGPTEQSVKRAKEDLKAVLKDITRQALSLSSGTQLGKYNV